MYNQLQLGLNCYLCRESLNWENCFVL